MLEAIVMALIYICLVALGVYLIFWVLEQIGIGVPEQVKKIIWVIAVLICVLVLVRVLLPGISHGRIGSITQEMYAIV